MAAPAELLGLLQLPRLAVSLPSLLRQPHGQGPALVLPGRGFDDTSTAPLRWYLRHLGYDATGWGQGPNRRYVRDVLPALRELVGRVAADAGPVALVGQSLGGYAARELARAEPDHVRCVVTLGSPVFEPLGRGPLRVPLTALYSRRDQVVPVARALAGADDVTTVEIRSTHFAMGVDPDVWRIVARTLAA